MAASKDKASALKNSYVDGIIDELGGSSDPAVRMAIRERDQASVHSFPEAGKAGVINDGDPNLYIHGNGKSYLGDTNPEYANPINGGADGQRLLIDAPEDAQQGGQDYLDEMERRMGGSGDLARARPKSQEDYKRKPQLLGNASFDASNLGGAMGMEQGNTAGVVIDLKNGGLVARNDGNPRFVIRDGNRMQIKQIQGAANPVPGGYGATNYGRLDQRDMQNFSGALYRNGNQIDTLGGDARSKAGVERLYNSAMYQPIRNY